MQSVQDGSWLPLSRNKSRLLPKEIISAFNKLLRNWYQKSNLPVNSAILRILARWLHFWSVTTQNRLMVPAGPSMVVGQLNDLLHLKITRNQSKVAVLLFSAQQIIFSFWWSSPWPLLLPEGLCGLKHEIFSPPRLLFLSHSKHGFCQGIHFPIRNWILALFVFSRYFFLEFFSSAFFPLFAAQSKVSAPKPLKS